MKAFSLALPIAFTFTLYGQDMKPITGYIGVASRPPIAALAAATTRAGTFWPESVTALTARSG